VGKVRWSFYWQLALLFVVPIVVYFSGLTGEIVIVALSMAVLRFVLFFVNYFSRIRFIIGDTFGSLMKSIFVPVGHSFLMFAGLSVLIWLLEGVSDTAIILVSIVTGIIIYGLLLMIFQQGLIKEI